MTKGWVRLHRQIEDNELYLLEPFTKGQAWIDLFLNANHFDGSFNIRGNIIEIKRGQIGWSELRMAKRWQWSKNKVRRFLKLLETKQQIVQQKTTLTTIITILNYDRYQQDDEKTEQQTIQQKDSRRYTNKNDNNGKNDKNKYIGFELHQTVYHNEGLLNDEDKNKRNHLKFPKENYNLVIKTYMRLKGISLSSSEFLPVQQAVKSMFISGHTPDDIILCMEFFAESALPHWQTWNINTVKMKMPEFKAGKLKG